MVKKCYLGFAALLLFSMFPLASAFADTLSLSDVTLNGQNADEAVFVSNENTSVAEINTLGFGTDYTFELKIEAPGDTAVSPVYQGLQFTLSATDLQTAGGEWTLEIEDTNGNVPLNLPTNLDIVVAIKAGNDFAAYFFDDIAVTEINDGTWQVAFTNKGGQIPNLSHMAVYIAQGQETRVPEPSSLLLLGSGITILGFAVRRMKK